MRFLKQNAIGLLALFVALGGTGYAATGGFTAASNGIRACAGSGGTLKLLTGKKCKKGQKALTWNQQGVPGAKGAAGATGPSGIAGLNGAAVPNATNATTAATATNALALGGIPASGFAQRACDSDTGQVKGWAQTPAKISSNFTSLGTSYSCSGGAVEARRFAAGGYIFRFTGNPAEVAMATAETGANEDKISANVHFEKPGEWRVLTFEAKNEFEDAAVNFVLF